MQGQVLGAFDLLFEQQQQHADCNDIFGQVPDFVLDLERRQIMLHQRGYDEHHGPGKKSADGNDRAGCAILMCVPEIQAAAQVNHEKDRVDTKIDAAARLPAQHQQLGAQSELESHRQPAQRMLGVTDVIKAYGQRT